MWEPWLVGWIWWWRWAQQERLQCAKCRSKVFPRSWRHQSHQPRFFQAMLNRANMQTESVNTPEYPGFTLLSQYPRIKGDEFHCAKLHKGSALLPPPPSLYFFSSLFSFLFRQLWGKYFTAVAAPLHCKETDVGNTRGVHNGRESAFYWVKIFPVTGNREGLENNAAPGPVAKQKDKHCEAEICFMRIYHRQFPRGPALKLWAKKIGE